MIKKLVITYCLLLVSIVFLASCAQQQPAEQPYSGLASLVLSGIAADASATTHTYDTDKDWKIGDFELLDAIDVWAQGNLGDFELLDLIDFWADACYHYDSVENAYKTGCSGDLQQVTIPLDASDIEIKGNNESTFVSFAYDNNGPLNYSSLTIDLKETLKSLSVSVPASLVSNQGSSMSILASQNNSTASVYVRIGAASELNYVCQYGSVYGPYTITIDENYHPVSAQPERDSISTSDLTIINTGSFSVCIEIKSPVEETVNLSDVKIEFASCEESPADFSGTWQSTVVCNDSCKGELHYSLTLYVYTLEGNSAYYYDTEGGHYKGPVCGNEFTFSGGGGGGGDGWDESGTFTLKDDGTGVKTSSYTEGACTGECTDTLVRVKDTPY